MSAQEIIAELPKLSTEEREMVLSKLVSLNAPFEASPAMEEAIREGLRSLREDSTFSAPELRSRIAGWTSL